MKLDERKEHILDFIIRDFVNTASPVSSGRMASKMKGRHATSPATLRNIMLELDEDGFLYQPHTSAGRAPTEKGYRYFVENLLLTPAPQRTKYEFSTAGLESFVDKFAHDLGVFASAMVSGRRELAGFSDILSEPEFREEEMLRNFGEMVDEIETVMSEYRKALIDEDDQFDIWIGRENIYPGARKGSSIVARIDLPRDEELVFFAFGPIRMDYEKAILRIKKLTEN